MAGAEPPGPTPAPPTPVAEGGLRGKRQGTSVTDAAEA